MLYVRNLHDYWGGCSQCKIQRTRESCAVVTRNAMMYIATTGAEKAKDLCNHFLFMDTTKPIRDLSYKSWSDASSFSFGGQSLYVINRATQMNCGYGI